CPPRKDRSSASVNTLDPGSCHQGAPRQSLSCASRGGLQPRPDVEYLLSLAQILSAIHQLDKRLRDLALAGFIAAHGLEESPRGGVGSSRCRGGFPLGRVALQEVRMNHAPLGLKWRLGVSSGLCAFLALVTGSAAGAATFKVTNTRDSGSGSLRHAMRAANANGSGLDKIKIRTSGTIHARSEIFIRTDVEVRGPGAAKLAIRGQAGREQFPRAILDDFGAKPYPSVTVSGLTL